MSYVIEWLTTYSIDLRERAVSYVHSGGSQVEAGRIFGVSTRTIQRWLDREDLTPLRECASHFGVHINAIWVALRQLNIVKKTTRYVEINRRKRMWFIRALRHWVEEYGSDNVVYFDESGFAQHSYRPHGWATRGVKIYGKITGNHRKGRTNLIMAQRRKE